MSYNNQPTLLIGQVYAVEVPEGATDIGWRCECLTCKLPGKAPGRYKWLIDIEQFMEKKGGEWEVLGTTKEVTEDIAKTIVMDTELGYNGYNCDVDNVLFWRYATDSLRSLLTSKGLDPNKNYVLIKKL